MARSAGSSILTWMRNILSQLRRMLCESASAVISVTNDPVTQWLEWRPLKSQVVGPNPTRVTKEYDILNAWQEVAKNIMSICGST